LFRSLVVVEDALDLRITLSVATYVGQMIGRIWIRPKVGSEAHVVVLVPARRRRIFLHHREWTRVHGLICLRTNSFENFARNWLRVREFALMLKGRCVHKKHARKLLSGGG